MENVGSVGNVSEGREGADDDEAGRDRRELPELQGEGGVIAANKSSKYEEDRKRSMFRWR